MNRTSLQCNFFWMYLILAIVIVSMVTILLYEQVQIREIRTEKTEFRYVRNDINRIHYGITELATQGEFITIWKETDYWKYHEKRLHVDSLLQTIESRYGNFVGFEQIDTLRTILKNKENHLLHIMEIMKRQVEVDKLLISHLPIAAKHPASIQTVVRKKKGIAGWFGGKDIVQVASPLKDIQNMNDTLVSLRLKYDTQVADYTNSLRRQNEELNKQLYKFVAYFDKQVAPSFKSKEKGIIKVQEFSYRFFAIAVIFTSLLLIIAFWGMWYSIRKERKSKVELQRINKENEDLLEMRKQIILTVSHDIRGPLGNINNCAELASDTREKKKRENYLENIRRSCRHILRLVNDLMDVYKMNEARDTRNEVPFRLDSFFESVSDEYSRKANDKALIFESEHKGSTVTVKGDADKIEQILNNLLTNAIKFTPSGTIRLFSEFINNKLYIEISDTGIGMNEETIKRVFRPFERAAQNINSEGFGLGLFITKELVKVLEGTINVESQPGKGTIFRLVFPISETTEEAETEKISFQTPILLPKKVLVVDDDSILLKITEDMLGRNGVECTTCKSLKEVVFALRHSNYDLVLTDIQMPVSDGFSLLKLLRSSDIGNSRTVPIAVMTARGDSDSGVYANFGFCGCIHKPFSMKGLLAFISSVISENVSEKTIFDYDRLMENTDDRQHMFSLIIKESKRELADLKYALKNGNREIMRETVHRMMPVWKLLGADDILFAYQDILHEKSIDDKMIKKYTLKIMEQLQILIDEAYNELEKGDNEKESISRGG